MCSFLLMHRKISEHSMQPTEWRSIDQRIKWHSPIFEIVPGQPVFFGEERSAGE